MFCQFGRQLLVYTNSTSVLEYRTPQTLERVSRMQEGDTQKRSQVSVQSVHLFIYAHPSRTQTTYLVKCDHTIVQKDNLVVLWH